MDPHIGKKPFVFVKDKDGNEFICPKEDLVATEKLSQTELEKYCIDDADKPWND